MFTKSASGGSGSGLNTQVTICSVDLLGVSSVRRRVSDYSEISEDVSYRNGYNTIMWVFFVFGDVGRWRTILSV